MEKMKMKMIRTTITILAILSLSFYFTSCNPIEDETQSASMLIVSNITGYDVEGNETNFLQSDVIKVDKDTGNTYVTPDIAKATLTAQLLQPDASLGASHYNSIQVTRYVVSYIRADGKSTEGLDVPYSFEGSLSTLVEVGQSVEVNFIIVRAAAKLEPPLVNLQEGRAEGTLNVTAKIDFYGHDMANRKVKATGYLTIVFANYIDQ